MTYTKSDKCLMCGEEIYNSKRDGKFLCLDCRNKIEQELMDILQASEYKEKIKNVSLSTCSSYGSSNKTTTIKVAVEEKRNIYVQIPTDKLLQIRDLEDNELLFEYLEIEIKCQYKLQSNKVFCSPRSITYYNEQLEKRNNNNYCNGFEIFKNIVMNKEKKTDDKL